MRAEKIACPQCDGFDSKVIDSRPSAQMKNACIRRRKCACGSGFSTIEVRLEEYTGALRALHAAYTAAESMILAMPNGVEGIPKPKLQGRRQQTLDQD